MPPLVVARVPDRVTAPVVLVLGENPVVPALNEVTPVAGAGLQIGTPEFSVKI